MADDDILKGIKKTHAEVEKIFKGIFTDSFPFSKKGEWVPPCDIYETDMNIVILVEIAGIDEKELKIILKKNCLNIKGFREDPSKVDGRRNYYYMELNFGPFEKSVLIPCPVNMDVSTAEYKQGLLKITLPKKTDMKKKGKIIEIE